ncbi:MAG: sigma 54-interacting transcriptional regulator [Thermoanaerobacteraceae bacterium]|nr:sigma 54-interacting transcriptional regulator [Thermoanaerobacteraceae bacterium]
MQELSELEKIQDICSQVSEAIASELNLDVEIVDSRLKRIAGTGKYRDRVGMYLNEDGVVYSEVIKTGRGIAVKVAGEEEICKRCYKHDACEEKAEVSAPIIDNGKVFGVIGLVCFTDEQKQHLIERLPAHKIFIEKMARLLASSSIEAKLREEERLFTQEIMLLIDKMPDPVIAIERDGKVLHINASARKLLNMESWQTSTIADWPGLAFLQDVISTQREIEERELFINLNDEEKPFLVSAYPMTFEKKVFGAMAILRPMAKFHQLFYDMTQPHDKIGLDNFVGVSKPIMDLKERVYRVAKSRSTVLITGESGTGKEILARAIHYSSERKDKPFITVNCGAIPDNLLESELFGYEEGAFTGAKKGGKPGKFEMADGGTIFLDEIGDMPIHLQVKLLRVLQDKEIERLGSSRTRKIDVRVIAATNNNIEEKVKKGEFREDLYYRLNVIPLNIPPLRERLEDLEPLIDYFIKKYSKLLSKNIAGIIPEALELLEGYSWPGNVRELENTIEYAINMEESPVIHTSSLPEKFKSSLAGSSAIGDNTMDMRNAEKHLICKALKRYGMSYKGKVKAADELGIGIATLYRKIREYSIDLSK